MQVVGHRGSGIGLFARPGAALALGPGAFRFLLACLVFVHHGTRLGLGRYAVWVFFVLSGFWVQRMWTSRYQRTANPYLTFMISRFWRLMPLFIVASMVAILATTFWNGKLPVADTGYMAHLLFSSVFILGYADLQPMPLGPGWSLDIELQYYALAPLVALLVVRLRPQVLIAAAILLSCIAYAVLPSTLAIRYLAFFVVGAVAAHIDWRPGKKLAFGGLAIVGVLLAVIAAGPWRDLLFGGARPGPLHAYNEHLNVLLAVLSIPFAIFTTRLPSGTSDRSLADMSYAVYLLHWPAIMWVATVKGSMLLRLEAFAMAWVVVLAASWLLWRFFDKPINERRAAWVQRGGLARRQGLGAGAMA